MRCIKCLNNLKKCRLIFGLCSVLLSVCFCLSGLLSQSVSAVELPNNFSTTNYSYDMHGVNEYIPSQTLNTWNWTTLSGSGTASYPNSGFDSFCFNTNSISGDSVSRFVRFNYSFTIMVRRIASIDWSFYSTPIISASSPYIVESDNVIIHSLDDGSSSGNSDGSYLSIISHNITGYVNNSDSLPNRMCFTGDVIRAPSRFQFDFYISPGVTIFFEEKSAESSSIDNQTQQQQEYHDQTQQTFDDAQDTADSDSDSSSSQATSSGTTLLAGFTSFLGALTNATPSNCVIDGNIGDFRMGNIDLCQLDPPPAFQAISSIMVIGFTVPLSIALGRKMISLFRSFQG